MSAKARHLQKKLDTAMRALQQIESIANSSLERQNWDSDLHWVLDGIADLAHYALEVADDSPQRVDGEVEELVAEEPASETSLQGGEDEDLGGGSRRSN
jgi:hypothetical protein